MFLHLTFFSNGVQRHAELQHKWMNYEEKVIIYQCKLCNMKTSLKPVFYKVSLIQFELITWAWVKTKKVKNPKNLQKCNFDKQLFVWGWLLILMMFFQLTDYVVLKIRSKSSLTDTICKDSIKQQLSTIFKKESYIT